MIAAIVKRSDGRGGGGCQAPVAGMGTARVSSVALRPSTLRVNVICVLSADQRGSESRSKAGST